MTTPSKWGDTEVHGVDVKRGILRLTAGEREVLQGLRDGKDFVCARPGGWYHEEDRIGGRVGMSLLRKALIRSDSNERLDADMIHYAITSMGQRALDGDDVPLVEGVWGHLL